MGSVNPCVCRGVITDFGALDADSGMSTSVLGDSLPDEDVVTNLRAWNDKTLAEIKWHTEHYEIAFPR